MDEEQLIEYICIEDFINEDNELCFLKNKTYIFKRNYSIYQDATFVTLNEDDDKHYMNEEYMEQYFKLVNEYKSDPLYLFSDNNKIKNKKNNI